MLETTHNQPLMQKISSKPIIENFETETIGLNNLGNTCYMNSFLQILFHTPGFLKELKKEKISNNPLVNNLIGVSEEPDNLTYLRNIKQLMGNINDSYGQFIQNDSQEFGIDLINELISSIKGDLSFSDEEDKDNKGEKFTIANKGIFKKDKFIKYIKKYYKKENEIPLEKMFQFHESKVEIESKYDNEISSIKNISFETFINIDLDFKIKKRTHIFELLTKKYFEYFLKVKDIKLEIPVELDQENISSENEKTGEETEKQNCNLKKICEFIKEIFSSCCKGINKFFCGNDEQEYENPNSDINEKNKGDLIFIKKIATLPKILILSINRSFLGDFFNDKVISFSDTLDIKKFIDTDLLDNENTEYKLYAINECRGHTKKYGHYYSYIKVNNIWYKFNDNSVTCEQPKFSSEYAVGLYFINKDLY